MDTFLSNFRQLMQPIRFPDLQSVGAPALVLVILALLVVPLPAFVLDILFTFNIMLGLLMVMLTINSRYPLDFSSFPSVLLIATCFGSDLTSRQLVSYCLRAHWYRRGWAGYRILWGIRDRRQLRCWFHNLYDSNDHQLHCGN